MGAEITTRSRINQLRENVASLTREIELKQSSLNRCKSFRYIGITHLLKGLHVIGEDSIDSIKKEITHLYSQIHSIEETNTLDSEDFELINIGNQLKAIFTRTFGLDENLDRTHRTEIGFIRKKLNDKGRKRNEKFRREREEKQRKEQEYLDLLSAAEAGDIERMSYLLDKGTPLSKNTSCYDRNKDVIFHVITSAKLNLQKRIEILDFLSDKINYNYRYNYTQNGENVENASVLDLCVDPKVPLSDDERVYLIKFLIEKRVRIEGCININYFLEQFKALKIDPCFFSEGSLLFYLSYSVTSQRDIDNLRKTIELFPFLINVKNEHGYLPIFWIIENELIDLGLLKDLGNLLKIEELGDIKDPKGNDLAHLLMKKMASFVHNEHKYIMFIKTKNPEPRNLPKTISVIFESIDCYIEKGMEVSSRDSQNRLPLYYAIKECINQELRIGVCQRLCEADTLKAPSPTEELLLSVSLGYFETTNLIINNYEDKIDKSILQKCLFEAAQLGDVKMVSLFLDCLSRKELLDESLIQQLFSILLDFLLSINEEDSEFQPTFAAAARGSSSHSQP